MNSTEALFSELIYDFQSERWNKFELPKLSLRELQILAKLLAALLTAPKKRSSFACSHNVNCASNSLVSQITLTSWRAPIGVNRCAICAGKPVFGDQANKRALSAGLLNWRDRCRARGQACLAEMQSLAKDRPQQLAFRFKVSC
jgi:hypothetical protein